MYLANETEVYEYLIEQIYRHIVMRGDAVVDVGADVGRHTIPLAELVGSEGSASTLSSPCPMRTMH